jgi:hypothetical protein
MIEIIAVLFLGAVIGIGVLWVFAVVLAEFQKNS